VRWRSAIRLQFSVSFLQHERAFRNEVFQMVEPQPDFPLEAPFFGQRGGELQHLHGVKGLLEN